MQEVERKNGDENRTICSLMKKFLRIKLQFIRHETGVYSGENFPELPSDDSVSPDSCRKIG